MKMNFKMALVGIVAGVALASCSDDDTKYTDDVYFTANQRSIVAVDKGASNPSIGSAATWVCFNAASNWQISAKDAVDRSKAADWVSFIQPNGGEGEQRVGVYTTANSGANRAAFIDVTCAGKTVEFLLVQRGTSASNPNASAINPNKIVSKIEYFRPKEDSPDQTITFAYSEGKMTEISTYLYDGEVRTNTYNISYDDVTMTVDSSEAYAILDSRAFVGYKKQTVDFAGSATPIYFYYDDGYLLQISGDKLLSVF